jgi:hypothetical protein
MLQLVVGLQTQLVSLMAVQIILHILLVQLHTTMVVRLPHWPIQAQQVHMQTPLTFQ